MSELKIRHRASLLAFTSISTRYHTDADSVAVVALLVRAELFAVLNVATPVESTSR